MSPKKHVDGLYVVRRHDPGGGKPERFSLTVPKDVAAVALPASSTGRCSAASGAP